MALGSPRADFRGFRQVPEEWPDSREHRILLAKAIQQLQGIVRHHPVQVVSLTASYTMVDIDSLILGDATAGNITVTLLTAAGREGREIYVKKIDSSSFTVTIDAAGSETLDGSTTTVLTQENAVRGYKSDGTNWRLISAVGNATSP